MRRAPAQSPGLVRSERRSLLACVRRDLGRHTRLIRYNEVLPQDGESRWVFEHLA